MKKDEDKLPLADADCTGITGADFMVTFISSHEVTITTKKHMKIASVVLRAGPLSFPYIIN